MRRCLCADTLRAFARFRSTGGADYHGMWITKTYNSTVKNNTAPDGLWINDNDYDYNTVVLDVENNVVESTGDSSSAYIQVGQSYSGKMIVKDNAASQLYVYYDDNANITGNKAAGYIDSYSDHHVNIVNNVVDYNLDGVYNNYGQKVSIRRFTLRTSRAYASVIRPASRSGSRPTTTA